MTETAQGTPVAEELVLEHIKIMQEENLAKKDLPTAIQNKMGGFGLQYGKHKKNPTENSQATCVRIDIEIADAIQDFVEAQAKGKADAQAKADAEEQAKADADAQAKADAEAQAKADAEAEALKNDPNAKMEASVRAKLVDGKISTADLKAILGRSPSTWKSEEKIGTLILRKVWLQEVWAGK